MKSYKIQLLQTFTVGDKETREILFCFENKDNNNFFLDLVFSD